MSVVGGVFTLESAAGRELGAGRKPGPSANSLPACYVGDAENALVRVAFEDLCGPQPRFSPVVFYGLTGLGKSLLATGIAHQLAQLPGFGDVATYTGASLSRAVGLAAETNSLPELGRRLAGADALIIDDLHQITGKWACQEPLLAALDQLAQRQARVVVTLRQAPAATPGLGEPLVSRLSAGLLVPLRAAGPHAMRCLARQFAARARLRLPDEVAEFLASAGSVPADDGARTRRSLAPAQLERVIQRLVLAAESSPLSVASAREAVDVELMADRPDLRTITAAVARFFDQRLEDLRGSARRRELVQARGIAMYLARRLTDKSLAQVGKHFGNRDHTTVLHACRQTEQLMRQDDSVRQAVAELVSQFAGLSGL